eukprot:scaffold22349_cov21-Tisochrysis_lutea.AAC.3
MSLQEVTLLVDINNLADFDSYHHAQVIYLTSLQEMTLVDMSNRGVTSKIEIESEPSFCGLGPNHAAVGMNNQDGAGCTLAACRSFELYLVHQGTHIPCMRMHPIANVCTSLPAS